MKVIILAAGRSNRVQPIADKNFLKFIGKYLIQHQIENLMDAGFDDFIIVGGAHNLDKLSNFIQAWNPSDIDIKVIEQENLDHGMAGAILSAGKHFGNEPILIVSSNDVIEPSGYEKIRKAMEDEAHHGAILGRKVSEYFPGGYLKVNDEGHTEHIVEKPGAGNEPSNLINLVVHAYRDAGKLLEHLSKVETTRDDRYEVALANMMQGGHKFKVESHDDFWQAIKYPWHVKPVFDYLFSRAKESISRKADIAKSAKIKGKVIIEEGCKILENAVLSGPVYVGHNTVIANNALVRDSHIGENCVIGYSTEIARSFLGSDVWTHSNYIGDSIIGDNNSFGSGAVTANLRLDEENIHVNVNNEKVNTGTNKFGIITGENVRVGVNTSIMPGIKIGANSMIASGIVVGEDIPEGSYVKGDWNLKISKNTKSLDPEKRDQMKKKL